MAWCWVKKITGAPFIFTCTILSSTPWFSKLFLHLMFTNQDV
jgi:hypothetical protein